MHYSLGTHGLGGWAQTAVVNGVITKEWPVTSEVPPGLVLGPGLYLYYLSLSRIWMRGRSASSFSLQMLPSWAGVLIGWRTGRLHRGIWTSSIKCPRPTLQGSTWWSSRSCTWDSWGWVTGKLPWGKRIWQCRLTAT